jgi:hypothetical protein
MSSISKKLATTKKKVGSKSKSKRTTSTNGASKRVLVDVGTDKRYVRRDAKGNFKKSDDVGRTLSEANDHMERAWDKIYTRREKSRRMA